MKKHWKQFLLFLILGAILGYSGFRFIAPSVRKAANGAKGKEYIVKKETVRQTTTISGTIAADEQAVLRFSNSGYLAWVGVKTGDIVKKWQAVASLDKTELQKTLEKYLNTYMNSRLDFDQTKDEYRQPAQGYWGLTWDQRNDVDRALQKAQYNLNSSVLDVELKNIALKYATLISPIDGIVTAVDSPVAGVNITPTQASITIINPKSLYFSLLPDQTEVTSIHEGETSSIVLDSYPDEPIPASVRSIAFTPKSGETSTVYEAKLFFPYDETNWSKYRIGMTGDASFVTKEQIDVVAIPATAIKVEKDKKYVMKKNGEKQEKVYIETGLEGDELTEIIGGLAPGDIIYD